LGCVFNRRGQRLLIGLMGDGGSVLLVEWSLLARSDKGVAALTLRDDL